MDAADGAPHPFRVLLVDLAKRFGGPETRVLGLARALQGRVERCAVAVTAGSPLHERLEALGIACEPVRAGRANPRLALELARVVRRGRYQVVDAHNIQSIFWGHAAALLGGARGRVTTLHTDHGQEYAGARRLLYPLALRLTHPATRQFIHVTGHLQDQAERRGDGARSTLIPNTVAVPPTPPGPSDPALKARWGWGDGDFVVAVVGRLFQVKGQPYLVDAMAELRDRPRVRLLLVGEGPLRAELEARAAELELGDRVRFSGFRADVPEVLRGVDCVCLPSLWEVLPYAALEAAAAARPVVATRVGGVAELFRDGETALLVPPRDPRALAAAIRALADDPALARRLGLAGYEMVRRSFDTGQMVRRTLEVYARALA